MSLEYSESYNTPVKKIGVQEGGFKIGGKVVGMQFFDCVHNCYLPVLVSIFVLYKRIT